MDIDTALNYRNTLMSIPTAKMDSRFENSIAHTLSILDKDSSWEIVRTLLLDYRASARALGLRIVRRRFRDKELLFRVIKLCFAVERLGELQYWYAAILSRYPIRNFLYLLNAEAQKRSDPNFMELHLLALRMDKMNKEKINFVLSRSLSPS